MNQQLTPLAHSSQLKTTRGLILLLCEELDNEVVTRIGTHYDFMQFTELKEAVKTLHNIRYDLVMLDERLFEGILTQVVGEIKHRFSSIPLLVISKIEEVAYHSSLIKVGVDAVVTEKHSELELQYRIQSLLNIYSHYHTFIRREQKLQVIAALPRLLESTSDRNAVILQAMKVVESVFHLHGIVVLLKEGAELRVYTGNSATLAENKFYESVYLPTEDDPYLWTIESGITQIYDTLPDNRFYFSSPAMPDPQTAVIMPLFARGERLGAMGIFPFEEITDRTIGSHFLHEDLLIFEQFTVQFTASLLNVLHIQAQNQSHRVHLLLLDSWKLFSNAHFPQEVAQVLGKSVAELSEVEQSIVWLTTDFTLGVEENWALTHSQFTTGNFSEEIKGFLRRAVGSTAVHNGNPPIYLSLEADSDPALHKLITLFEGKQLILFPLLASGQAIGGLLISTNASPRTPIDTTVIENILQIAQTTFARVMLSNTILENHDQFVSILCAISEGLFFVDRAGKIVLFSPQMTDLTLINASSVINQDAEVMLRALADRTSSPAHYLAQMQAAREKMLQPSYDEAEYPILSLTLIQPAIDIELEFIPSSSSNATTLSWLGVIRLNPNTKRDMLLDSLIEDVTVPITQVQSMVMTLREQHGHFSYRQREQLINQITASIQDMGNDWEDFHNLYRLRFGAVNINREHVKVQSLVERALNRNPFRESTVEFNIQMPLNPLFIDADELVVEKALTSLLQYALRASMNRTPILVRIEKLIREVSIRVEHGGKSLAPGKIEEIFGVLSNTPRTTTHVDLYIANELIRRNGGRAWAETLPGSGTAVTIILPLVGQVAPNDIALPSSDEMNVLSNTTSLSTVHHSPSSRTPERDLHTITVIVGRSRLIQSLLTLLKQSDYEVFTYNTSSEAVSDLNMTRVDLVIIDTTLEDTDVIAVCKQIRHKTELPIILIGDTVTAQQKVQGLNAGAEEYISEPVTEEEMLARIRVIFSRKRIADRTSEPFIAGELLIDFARRAVFIGENPVDLTRIEYDLLHVLVTNKGQTLTQKQLLSEVWGPEYVDEKQYLWVNISRLRKKLESPTHTTRYVRTQPGIGYYFDEK